MGSYNPSYSINNAEDLLEALLELKEEFGSLHYVPITMYIDGDRKNISELDVFLNDNDTQISLIDINLEP
jgi:hypothetical protein